jgi:hypothetical protein
MKEIILAPNTFCLSLCLHAAGEQLYSSIKHQQEVTMLKKKFGRF